LNKKYLTNFREETIMIKVVARFVLKEDKINEFLDLTTELVEKSRKDPGCISYDLFQDVNDPTVCAFIETWEDQEALDNHMKAEHFIRIGSKLGGLTREKVVLNTYKQVK